MTIKTFEIMTGLDKVNVTRVLLPVIESRTKDHSSNVRLPINIEMCSFLLLRIINLNLSHRVKVAEFLNVFKDTLDRYLISKWVEDFSRERGMQI